MYIHKLPGKYFSQVTGKSDGFTRKINKRSEKELNRLLQQEKKMQAKLAKTDSVAARNIFARSIDSLGSLRAKLGKKVGQYNPVAAGGAYSGYLDTLQGSLSFLKNAEAITRQSKAVQEKVNSSLQSVQHLQSQLQQAEQIKAYIREHKQQLKAQLSQYAGFTKDLEKINKQAYYYGQQLMANSLKSFVCNFGQPLPSSQFFESKEPFIVSSLSGELLQEITATTE